MARPKKEKELKRDKHIMLRLTDVEYEVISQNAKNARLPLAQYARLQAMDKKVTVKYEIVADVPELKKLTAEFGKIGGNLNQIARHFNQGGTRTPDIEKSLRQCFASMYELKYEVLKMAGDFTTIGTQTDVSGENRHGDSETHSS